MPHAPEIYVVGRLVAETDAGSVWELQGIYEDEQDAVKGCTRPEDFVGPCPLNEALPDETVEWPGAYFPLAGE